MSQGDWRVRRPDAPHTALSSLDPTLPKRTGRPRKDAADKARIAKEAARALVNAQIAKLTSARMGETFTVEGAQERVADANGYQSTPEALKAAGAVHVAHSESTPEVAHTIGTLGPDRDAPAPEPPAARAVGGEAQGTPVSIPDGAHRLADGTLVLYGATALHHTELAPGSDGTVRVRTGSEQEESIVRYIHARMLNDAWTDEQCGTLGKELHRAEHTIRMYANRAARRMAEPVAQNAVHTSLYKRARMVADIALENYQAVHEPAYGAVALRALETELKVSGLLPKELPPARSPAEMRRALLGALARVEAMATPGAGGVVSPVEGSKDAGPGGSAGESPAE